ncbi:putative quinol monooxygenase [Massilia sp. YIM B02763]|uniref:putative quinol monooxygenase n=1 Tax=Massilia sp. YIM B02763 TaxID=3050130 RepID=UPI0025B63E69|nr:putative quinol monooxygenase [Massilia sp. YIM B02763]MDN4055032.1 putative quinol monooxygenase [Massilia sp. YIM B02763]
MNDAVKITALLIPRPGQAAALEALLFDMAPRCRAEPGNLRWDVWREQGQGDERRFVLDELYRDNEAVAAHRATPHFKHYLATINDLAERVALVLDPAQVA